MSNVDPLSSNAVGQIICHYKNKTGRLQIIRIKNIPERYFERVVFPGQELIFHAALSALLEVHSCEMATAILVERIPCSQLRCKESVPASPATFRKQDTGLKAA